MIRQRFLPIVLLWACSRGNLLGQVQEMQQADDVDLAGTRHGADGIRISTLRCRVRLEHGRPLSGAFFVVTDVNTKTYWWVLLPLPASPSPRRLSWAGDFQRYRIEKTPSGFTVFYTTNTKIYIASSRGRFASEGELASLVRKDFDAMVGSPPQKGFAFVDGRIELRDVLPEQFFFRPFSAVIERPKLEVAKRLANGNWELAVSSGVGKIAYLDLAPDFSVNSHRIVDR